jgi:uncharacterized protein (TIRG00374 family)
MTRLHRRGIQLGLLVIAGGLLWLTLRSVPLTEVWAVLRRLGPLELMLLILTNAAVLASFNLRWWLLLRAQGYTLPYLHLVGYRLATFAVSYFTPGSHFGGEPLQVYLTTHRHGVPAPVAISAVLLDRVIELLVNFVFLVCGILIFLPQYVLSHDSAQYARYGIVLLLAPVGLVVALGMGRHPLARLVAIMDVLWRSISRGRRMDALARIGQAIRQGESQAAVLCRQQPGLIVLAVAASLLSWAGMVGEYWLMTTLLGLDLTLSRALVALLAARVAILAPMPAGIGVLEASQALAMHELGLPMAAGVSLSLLIRGRDVIVGLAGLWIGSGCLWGGRRIVR